MNLFAPLILSDIRLDVQRLTCWDISVLVVPLYDSQSVLHPEPDGGGGRLVVVVLGRAALILSTVRETGQTNTELGHSVSSGLVNLNADKIISFLKSEHFPVEKI